MSLNGDSERVVNLRTPAAWAELWHVWTVFVPRRSITGRLVFGIVWRRHDGRRWVYKKFDEYAGDERKD
jgi:hypothetical protein